MTGVKCTDKSRKMKRARRARRRLIAGMTLLFLALCVILIGVLAFQFFFREEHRAAEFELEHYNQAYDTVPFTSADLCVAASDIDLPSAPDASAFKAAALFDLKDLQTIYAKNVHERVYPASTTKVMTALVALQNGNLEDVVTVSANAANRASDESVCGLKEGDQLTFEDLLIGLLLQSGNDNAVAIAEHIAGSEEAFVEMMNEEAARLMATNTHFVSPHGLQDDDHYTTAYDLYLIFNEAIKQDKFLEIIQMDSYNAHITHADGTEEDTAWEASNFYARGEAALPTAATVIGGKTGTTQKAGNCLILLAEDEKGDQYVSVIMGAETKDLLYTDMTALIDGGVAQTDTQTEDSGSQDGNSETQDENTAEE